MEQSKKFISPGAWFSMTYPVDWNEFEDGEGSFLFYNPNEWTGNPRIPMRICSRANQNEDANLVVSGYPATWLLTKRCLR